MNNEEAKFILQAYRPGGPDAGDPAFAAALEQVQRDPALRDWFARQQVFDAAVSAKLNAIQPPAGLREAILAGGRVTASDQPQARWWRASAIMAAAASVAVIFATVLALWPQPAVADTTLADYVLTDAAHSGDHGGHGTDVLQAMLADPVNRLGRGLPVSIAALRKDGCRTLTFEGREVLEVCFNRGGLWFHAYIGQRADFPALAPTPIFLEKAGMSVTAWADDTHVYLVAGKAGRAALEQML